MHHPSLQSAETAAFVDLWYATRTTVKQPMPTKIDMPLRDLAQFMPKLVLIDTEETGRGKYILFGTAIVEAFGIDMTGRYVDEVMDAQALAMHMQERREFHNAHGLDAIHGRWAIGRAHTNTGRLVEYEDLSLPYHEPATGKVRHMVFLTMLAELEFGEGVATRLPSKQYRWFDSAAPRPDWLFHDTSTRS
jgi:hypothetical protein